MLKERKEKNVCLLSFPLASYIQDKATIVLTHTHTHTHIIHTLIHKHSHSNSLSLTHTLTHSHTKSHTLSHTHTQTLTQNHNTDFVYFIENDREVNRVMCTDLPLL